VPLLNPTWLRHPIDANAVAQRQPCLVNCVGIIQWAAELLTIGYALMRGFYKHHGTNLPIRASIFQDR
jgi:hypothetical protein